MRPSPPRGVQRQHHRLDHGRVSDGPGNDIILGTPNIGLNTALTDITLDTSQTFIAWMTAAAFGAGTNILPRSI